MSTSQSKSERPQEVSQGEVEVPVSTVVSLMPPEVVNGQEETVANQQPQQMKGIRRRNQAASVSTMQEGCGYGEAAHGEEAPTLVFCPRVGVLGMWKDSGDGSPAVGQSCHLSGGL